MYITRELGVKLLSLAQHFPAIVLTGARQVGKTTLLKQVFPDYSFISLDLPSVAEMAENEPELFLKQYPAPLIVDEVQYAPKLFRHLKYKIDQNRHLMGQYILTGSQKFTLMKEVADSLAGRAAIVNLENLSSSELKLQSSDQWLPILARGFYPELWRQKDLGRNDFYHSYVSSYLERDVRQILNVNSLRDFERFIRSCAARSAQLLNLSELARDVGIKSQTARDWLSVLEASNQISLLEPYFENVGKRIVKSPKLYLNDPGMLCYLLGIDADNLTNSPLIGAVWETFIYAEFRKWLANREQNLTLWYYRDSQGWEADFVLTGNANIDIFEAKWTESPDSRWITRLKEIAGVLNRSSFQKVSNLYIFGRINSYQQKEGAHLVHPCEFFL